MCPKIAVLAVIAVSFFLAQSAQPQSIQLEHDGTLILLFAKPFSTVVSTEQSPDLLVWTPANSWEQILSQSSKEQVVQSVVPGPLAATKMFFRLRMEKAWTVALSWNRSPSEEVAGYCVHYGIAPGTYSQSVDVGDRTTTVVSLPLVTKTCYFVVTAYNAIGLQSAPSGEVKVKLRTKRKRAGRAR